MAPSPAEIGAGLPVTLGNTRGIRYSHVPEGLQKCLWLGGHYRCLFNRGSSDSRLRISL